MNTKFKTLFVIFAVSLLTACGSSNTPRGNAGIVTLTLASYSTAAEAYAKIIPLFTAYWKAQKDQDVTFETSYAGSGAQSRAVIGGLDADVVALSLEGDVTNIAKADLIKRDWQAIAPNKGIVSTSIVAFAVRKGNPKNIHDWADLAQPGLEVLTPNPKTSGGAQWNFLALYGAAERGHASPFAGGDAGAMRFAAAVFHNVTGLDKGARESIISFERGLGDAAITYENQILAAQGGGRPEERVLPESTIGIETPVAVGDVYAARRGVREGAQVLGAFLGTPEAQGVFARHGFRPVD